MALCRTRKGQIMQGMAPLTGIQSRRLSIAHSWRGSCSMSPLPCPSTRAARELLTESMWLLLAFPLMTSFCVRWANLFYYPCGFLLSSIEQPLYASNVPPLNKSSQGAATSLFIAVPCRHCSHAQAFVGTATQSKPLRSCQQGGQSGIAPGQHRQAEH